MQRGAAHTTGPASRIGDNLRMIAQPTWHPVVPAQGVGAAGAIVAARVQDQPLALWRSSAGVVQAWEDRCPHRGVALSLGRVLGDRLACAYHGWEYAEGSGRCIAIPAMPRQPVPGTVCVTTHAALEHDGMVWVALNSGEPVSAAPPPAPHGATLQFLRSVAVAAPHAMVAAALAAAQFTPAGPCQWRGRWAGHGLHLWLLDAATDWCMLHVAGTTQPPSEPAPPALFHALRGLRDRLQARPN